MRIGAQRGQAIVLLAMMMAILVGFVALAIDSARAFDSRRILQDSVDAASLAAAESFQAGASWGTAQANAMTIFERDNRLYGGDNCSAGGFLAPTLGSPVTTTCTVGGGSGYTVQITASDNGAAGQTFLLKAQRSLPVALMQALSGTASIVIRADGGSVANDQSQTPALGALSQDNTCPGGTGVVSSLHIENQTNFMTVEGDVVTNGGLNMGGLSYLRLAGNALTRCAAPVNANHITYQCWLRDEPPPPACPPGEPPGTLYSTTNRLADPGYRAPATNGGCQAGSGNPVVLSPGICTIDPNFSRCYFLAPGVYEWQGGLTVSSGLISNELKPPREPGGPALQFWHTPHCSGDFAVTFPSPTGGQTGFPSNTTYSVVLTSVRKPEVVNGVTYVRESAPSACQSFAVPAGKVIQLVVSNVPGAQSYNVYAATNNTCTPPFGLVTSGASLSAGAESNETVSGCPDMNVPATNCTLGQAQAIYDYNFNTTISSSIHPPANETAAFATTTPPLPGQNAARATPPAGDLANENQCATLLGTNTTCPANMSNGANAKYVTPGAVVMKVTQGSCINVAGGDAFLFSGYQYNWIVNYEPAATSCTNNWNGVYNSAAIGLSYTPGAAFTISGDTGCSGGGCNNTWSFEAPMGGILAATIHIGWSSGLNLDFDPHYAPGPPGARLFT